MEKYVKCMRSMLLLESKFIRSLCTTDVMFEQVRLLADHVRIVHEGAAGNIPDLHD